MHIKFPDTPSGRTLRDQRTISGEHIAMAHRQYSSHTKSIVEHKINIIYKAEFEKYEMPNIPTIYCYPHYSQARVHKAYLVQLRAHHCSKRDTPHKINTNRYTQHNPEVHHTINNSGKTYERIQRGNTANSNELLCFIKRRF
jgi:hypothetical protein